MKPLVLLIGVFFTSLLITRLTGDVVDVDLSGRIAMTAMLLLTAIGHFKFKKGMALMIPAFIPAKDLVVLVTGILEILAAIGLLISSTERLTGICLMIFFLLLLPANMYASTKKLNFETGEYNGAGLSYLWFRIPLQVFFIFWVYWFAVKI